MDWLHRNSYLYYALNHYGYQKLIVEQISELDQRQRNSKSRTEQEDLYINIVKALASEVTQNNSKFAAVMVYWKSELLENETSPNERVMEILLGEGIVALDMFDDLKQRVKASKDEIYYLKDPHWNAQGNTFVAEKLEPKLTEWLER